LNQEKFQGFSISHIVGGYGGRQGEPRRCLGSGAQAGNQVLFLSLSPVITFFSPDTFFLWLFQRGTFSGEQSQVPCMGSEWKWCGWQGDRGRKRVQLSPCVGGGGPATFREQRKLM